MSNANKASGAQVAPASRVAAGSRVAASESARSRGAALSGANALTGGPKLGRKPAFDAADVVAAAIAEGIDKFTLSAVARRLGVVTGAIYRTFPSRDDLVIACLDAAGARSRFPNPASIGGKHCGCGVTNVGGYARSIRVSAAWYLPFRRRPPVSHM